MDMTADPLAPDSRPALFAWGGSFRRELAAVLREIAASAAWKKVAFFLLPYVGVILGMDVAAHYGAATGALLPVQMYISQDGSFGEWVEYFATGAVAAMLFVLWRRTRAAIYGVNALLFVYLTADNALTFHERFGHWVAPTMPQGLPLAPNHLGEMLLLAIIGLAWIAALLTALRTARLRPAIHALILAAGVAGAAFFGVVADALTSWGAKSLGWTEFEAWVEDGGEFAMIVLTLLACTALFDAERRRRAQ